MQKKLLHCEFLGDKDHVSLFNADPPMWPAAAPHRRYRIYSLESYY